MSSQLTVAREIAYDAFIEVMEHKRSPDEVTDRLFLQFNKKIRRLDRNFVKEILFGGLRWYSKIHWIVQNTSKRDLDKTSPEILAALILGTYQIFYMDRVPDRAAVNESVEYVRKKGQARAVNFVNGILRTISRRAEYFSKPDRDKKPCEFLALQYSHPQWIVDRWYQRFNFERVKSMLAANNQPPPYSVRINLMKVDKDAIQEFRSELLKDEGVSSFRRALRSCLQLSMAPDFSENSLFAKGYYTVQDEAAQLISYLVDPQEGDTIVDACCGPGGKTTHLYEVASGKAKLIGLDRDAKQIERAQSNASRLGHQGIEWKCADFLNYQSESSVNRVLLDAPCSGFGVLRRHPEGKWHKSRSVISQMAQTQRKLLAHAIEMLPKGGELVYSVCSFEPEETIEHIAWLRSEYQDTIELVPPGPRLPDYYSRFVTREQVLLIYSGNKESMDGFGSFVLKKL